MSKINIACVQMRSGTNIDENIATASAAIRQAHTNGAQFITTPEMTSLMEQNSVKLMAKVKTQKQDQALQAFQKLAKQLKVNLLIGSLAIKVSDDKCANRCFLLSTQGEIIQHYDKIHMFDVTISENEKYQESKQYQAGKRAAIARVGKAVLGMSICYDLRFPRLFTQLAKAGAQIITVPAAFTKVTGQAHWHSLLKARAIENGCYIIAPAQTGRHQDGRETFGHSMIINPWGSVLAEAEAVPCVIQAEIDLSEVVESRNRIPNLNNDRSFAPPQLNSG